MQEIYLLYHVDGWGVFDSTSCPDLEIFPKWCYRKYEVSDEQFGEVFRKLLDIQERLTRGNVIPTPGNNKIFPKLEELIDTNLIPNLFKDK